MCDKFCVNTLPKIFPIVMIFACSGLAVSPTIMQHIVRIESSGNPYAIGVVGGRLQRQPRNINEAIATAKMLEKRGYNFSLGIAQINWYNLRKYGLHTYEHAFQICPNLKAGSLILKECFNRSGDWGKAFSCYYSGNFVTGYKHGYVQKIFASMGRVVHSSSSNLKNTLALQNKGAIVVSHNYDLLKKESSKDSQESFQNGTIKSIKTKVGEKLPLQKGSGIAIENNIDSSFVF